LDKIILEVFMMKVSEFMTKDIASVNREDTVERAAQMMKEYNVGSIPVVSENKIVGIVTDRDIVLRSAAEGENIERQQVKDIMTSNPVVGKPDMDVHEAASLMSDRQIRRLPIVDKDNLVGIVSLGDLAVEPKLQDDAESALKDISEPSTPTI
jgi:CBS domain-containing protein